MIIATLALLIHASVPTPPVEINHFYITLDRTTFNAVKKNKWLKDNFANVNVSTQSSGADTWTGIYVYGIGSYVEIFQAGKRDKEGSAGLAFLTTEPGGVDNVYTNFRESSFGTRAQRDVMQLGSEKEQKPFAHIVSYDGQDGTNLNVWLMEFHAAYYERNGVPVGSTSAAINAAYDKRHNTTYNGMMGDITSLTVQPTGDGKDFAQALHLFGYKQSGEAWRQGSNEVIIRTTKNSVQPYAISSVRFSLRKPSHAHVERFGPHSQLSVYPDGRAEWRFR